MTMHDFTTHVRGLSELSLPSKPSIKSKQGWFSVRTKPSREQFARDQIQRAGFEVFLPVYEREMRHARRKWTERRAVVAGYVFAQLDLNEPYWGAIERLPGVIGLLRIGPKPVRLTDSDVKWARSLEQLHNGLIPAKRIVRFKPGEFVRAIEGLMLGYSGEVKKIEKIEREPVIVVEMLMLGRPCEFRFADEDLEPVDAAALEMAR